MSSIETGAVVEEAIQILSEAQKPKIIELPAAAIYDMRAVLQPLFAEPEKVTPEIENLKVKLDIANSQTGINKDASVSLTGQEIDFLTNRLTPYETALKKNDGIDAHYVDSIAQYSMQNPHASSNEVKAFADFSKQRLQHQLETHEQTAATLHSRYEATGGMRRESFRRREGLLLKSRKT